MEKQIAFRNNYSEFFGFLKENLVTFLPLTKYIHRRFNSQKLLYILAKKKHERNLLPESLQQTKIKRAIVVKKEYLIEKKYRKNIVGRYKVHISYYT